MVVLTEIWLSISGNNSSTWILLACLTDAMPGRRLGCGGGSSASTCFANLQVVACSRSSLAASQGFIWSWLTRLALRLTGGDGAGVLRLLSLGVRGSPRAAFEGRRLRFFLGPLLALLCLCASACPVPVQLTMAGRWPASRQQTPHTACPHALASAVQTPVFFNTTNHDEDT